MVVGKSRLQQLAQVCKVGTIIHVILIIIVNYSRSTVIIVIRYLHWQIILNNKAMYIYMCMCGKINNELCYFTISRKKLIQSMELFMLILVVLQTQWHRQYHQLLNLCSTPVSNHNKMRLCNSFSILSVIIIIEHFRKKLIQSMELFMLILVVLQTQWHRQYHPLLNLCSTPVSNHNKMRLCNSFSILSVIIIIEHFRKKLIQSMELFMLILVVLQTQWHRQYHPLLNLCSTPVSNHNKMRLCNSFSILSVIIIINTLERS